MSIKFITIIKQITLRESGQVPTSEWPWFWLLLSFILSVSLLACILYIRHLTQRLRQPAHLLQSQQVKTSIELGQQINRILDLDQLLPEAAQLILERFDYEHVGVFLFTEDGTYVEARGGAGDTGTKLSRDRIQLKVGEEGIVGWVAAHGCLANVGDVAQDGRFRPNPYNNQIASELALPLRVGEKMLGVLDVQSCQPNEFSQADEQFLGLLADQLAIAIANAHSYRAEKNARQVAELMQKTGHILNRSLDWNSVLNVTLEQLQAMVPSDRSSMLVPNGDELMIVASRGFPAGFEPANVLISLEDDLIYGEIYKTQRPFTIPDITTRPDLHWQQVPDLPQARSWLGVPLLHSGEVVGMVSLTRGTATPFDTQAVELAVSFASQAAIALENARLYRRLNQFNQQMEYEVRNRTHAVQEAYEKLELLNQTKSDFISIASHELRTPLTIVNGYSQILLRDEGIVLDENRLMLVQGIQTGAERLNEIVESMLDTAKIENQTLEIYPESVPLSVLIHFVSNKFTRGYQERNIKLIIDDLGHLPSIQADPEALQKVFYNLIINAIKYTPDGGQIKIYGRKIGEHHRKIDIDLPEEGVILTVKDTGIGVPDDSKELIFTKFYQTGKVSLHSSSKTNFKGGGPGLGLAIAKGIVDAHRGKIWVESKGYDETELHGSAFHVALPLEQPHAPADKSADE